MPGIVLGTLDTAGSKIDRGNKVPAVYWRRQTVNG